jgi:general secretion pathway protein J
MSGLGGSREPEHGFTLIELLVAITLFALLMAALSGGLRLGTRVWETADARLDASARTQIVQEFIRQRLAETLPLEAVPPEGADVGVSEPLFLGTAEGVRFASLLPENLGAGVHLMELTLAESGAAEGTGRLVLRWRPVEPSDGTAEEVEPEELMLIDNVAALELSYFGTVDPAQPPEWWPAWESRPELPQLIRLRLRLADSNERQWPELIVQPMVDRALAFGL